MSFTFALADVAGGVTRGTGEFLMTGILMNFVGSEGGKI